MSSAPVIPEGSVADIPGASTTARQSYRGVNVILRILRMASRYRGRMALGLVCAIAAANFQLLIPRYLGAAVDHAQALLTARGAGAADALAALRVTALMLLGAGFLRGIFTMVQNYCGEAVGQQISYGLRLAYFEKLQRMSFSYHDRTHSGDLMTRGMLDIDGMRRLIDNAMYRVIVLLILVAYGGYHLLKTDAVLAAIAISFVPLVAWRAAVSRLWLRRSWRQVQECLSILTRTMEENLGGIRVVRAFVAQKFELSKFDAVAKQAIAMAIRRVEIRYNNGALMILSYYVAMGLVLWVGGSKVISGTLTVGALTEFLAFMAILQQPVRQIGMIVNSTARASISGRRVFEIIDLEPAIKDQPGAGELALTHGVLRFEHVAFTYEGAGAFALRDICFEVGPGRTLGIVGPPGSGKSTLAHLIPRFYDVGAGRITIDSQDIREVSLESLRNCVGVMQQDTFLFSAPIESNIAYGEPDAHDERIADAAGAAQLHDYIERLPAGYETLVGERGITLSGGQRQRLSIARSLLPRPAILVFDDSTAAIDAGTEQRIRSALRELARDHTTIIISHRLHSLMHADEILFLEAGRIVERGTHAELLAFGGRYRELYDLQVAYAGDTDGLPPSAEPGGASARFSGRPH